MKTWLRSLVPVHNTIPYGMELPTNPLAFIWFFIRQIKLAVALFISVEIIAAASQLIIPLLTSGVVIAFSDNNLDGTIKKPSFWMMVAFAVLFRPLAGILYNYVLGNGYRPYFANMIRKQLHGYILHHSLAFFQNDFAGRIASRVTEVGSAIRAGVETAIGTTLYALMVFIGAFGLMSKVNWRLSCLLMVWFAAYILIGKRFIPQIHKTSSAAADYHSTTLGHRVDAYSHMNVVKGSGAEDFEVSRDLQNISAHNMANQDLDDVNFKLRSCIELSNAFLLGGLILICIWLRSQSQINASEAVLALTLTAQLLNMSGWVLNNTANLADYYGKAVDAIQALVKPLTVQDHPNATTLQVTAGSITLQNVTFQYGRGVGGIKNINLHIRPGEKIGVVGKSGDGKSTLAAAICRLFDREHGIILIDGQDIATVTQRSLRQALAVVTQEAEIFHRSIAENIAYGNPNATREEIIAAARKANAHDFIVNLEDPQGRKGYDAVVGERGIRLSGGQRQRIAIARVLFAHRPILILDEATSALDSESEAAIQDNLGLLMEGRTVIAIAHRLSTLKTMDRIIVMAKGEISEQGTHQQLLAKGGIYAKLWNLQTEGFLPAEAA